MESCSAKKELMADALEVAAQLKGAGQKAVKLAAELNQAEYGLVFCGAVVEMKKIDEFGDEKKLGTTVDARERRFILARDESLEYQAALKARDLLKIQYEYAKIEASALKNVLNLQLAVLQADNHKYMEPK